MAKREAKRHLLPNEGAQRTWCSMPAGALFWTTVPSASTCQGCLKRYWMSVVEQPTDIMEILVALAGCVDHLTPSQQALYAKLTGTKRPSTPV